MPRAAHPIDKVMEYFQTAPLDAAEQALHVAKQILKQRTYPQAEPAGPGTGKGQSKPPRKKRVKVPKPTPHGVPTLTPAQAGAE